MRDKTSVYLTVDLECRLGCAGYETPIYGKIGASGESYGLEFILETLEKFDLKATFFVEPFFSYKFGLGTLEKVCGKILRKRHDIQLHMHPYFKSTNDRIFKDKLFTYNYADQVSLIREAKGILLKCGVSDLTAFRAGSFTANNATYDALKACDIRISSSYNLNYLDRNCRIDLWGRHNDLFFYKGNILEIPITCFYEFNLFKFKNAFRHMQIGAASFSQMRYVIDRADFFNIKNVTVLLHTFEFINFIDESKNICKFNAVNIARFLRLCEFLSNNREKIEVKRICDIDAGSGPRGTADDYAVIPGMPIGLSVSGGAERIRKRMF